MAFLYEIWELADYWKSLYERMIPSIVWLRRSDDADYLRRLTNYSAGFGCGNDFVLLDIVLTRPWTARTNKTAPVLRTPRPRSMGNVAPPSGSMVARRLLHVQPRRSRRGFSAGHPMTEVLN